MEQTTRGLTIPEIQNILKRIRTIVDQYGMTALTRQISVCETLTQENPPIDVAVLGQFKSGKSSFINTLIGREILPVGVIPVTTVITRLQYGARERARVTFLNGEQSEIPLSCVQDYTSEAVNPNNKKNVEVVDIELPGLEPYPGLRLVDTPGLGSVFKIHREVSEHWLPEVGAAIVAISADRPLSEHDIDLIEDLLRLTPRIVLLLTKADLLTSTQQTEVVQFFQQTLKRELGRELPIFLFSTRSQTDLYRERIENGILFKISLNRNLELNRIVNHKTRTLLKGCLAYLDIALKTSIIADQDREALTQQILDERVNFAAVRDEIAVIARENQRQTRPLLMQYLERFHKPITEKLLGELNAELPAWQGNLWKLTRRFETWLTERMTEEMLQLSETEHSHFFGSLKKAHMSLARSVETFRMLLNDNVHKTLGLTLPETEWQIDVSPPLHPDIKILYAFDFHFDLIWFLIPMFIFRGSFERHFRREIPKAVVINLSRLAAQWEDNINKTIDAMRRQASAYIQDEIGTIETLLSQAQGQTDTIGTNIKELQGYLMDPASLAS